jgi:iron complex outermembrane receptor protein
VASGPLGAGVATRVAVSYDDMNGYIANSLLGGKEPARRAIYARWSLLFEPDDRVSLVARVEGGTVDLKGTASERFESLADPDLIRATGGFPNFVGRDFDETTSLVASVSADVALGRHRLSLISAWSRYDFTKRLDSDFGPVPVLGTEFREDFSQLSQEIRLASPEGATFDWIVGAYFHGNDYQLGATTAIALGPFNGQSIRDFRQSNETLSFFGQAGAALGAGFRLVGGLRYTDDRKTARQSRRNIGRVVPTWRDTPLAGARTERIWDPSLTLQWQASPAATFYGGWGRGSKAGGFVGAQTTTAPDQFELEPERSETFEAGAKLALAGRSLFWNMAAFSTLFRDLQVSSFDAPTAAFISSNAGRARSRGVETDLVWRIADGWRLQAAFAYLDASYTDFPGAPCPFDNPTCNPATNNATGKPLPRAPRWSGSATLFGRLPLGGRLALLGELGGNFRDKVFLEQTYNPAAAQSAFMKIDARLAIEAARFELALVGRNLTNKITGNHAFGTPFAPAIVSKYIDPPRTLLLTARVTL